MELTDSAVDGFFFLAEKVDLRCPECRCPLVIDTDTDTTVCPKCNWTEQ